MAVPVTFAQATGASDKTRMGKRSYVGAFIPGGYTGTGKTFFKAGGVWCVAKSVTAPTLAPINEVEIMAIGKSMVTVNEGTSWDGYSLTVHGNAQGILRVMSNTDVASLSVAQGYQYSTNPFWLVEHSYAIGSNTISKSSLYPYAIARTAEFAGLEPDSDTDFSIEFYNSDATDYSVRHLKPGNMWVAEGWYDNGGSVVNSAAPDGTLTAFTLGTGNGSYVGTPATPVAIVFDNSYTGAAKYLYVFVNGVDVTSTVTFNAGTSVITFATAPADGAKMVVIYAMAQAASAPGWDGGVNPTNVNQFHYGLDAAGLA